MERSIVLPVKFVAIAILLHSFYTSPWFGTVSSTFEVTIEAMQNLLWIYIGISLLAAVVLMAARHVPVAALQWTAFTMTLVDGVFILALAVVIYATDALYWVFPALIVRAAFSVPRPSSQILLSLTLIACYGLTCFVEVGLGRNLAQAALGFPTEHPLQPILMQFVLLLSVTAWCYGIQILVQRSKSRATPIAE
jgi:hypothetical protein